MRPPPPSDGVTVAICTWNRSRLLGETLSRLSTVRHLERGRWEVIVVTNNCTDDSSAVIARFRDRLPIREVVETRQGISNARNRALREAAFAVIVFTDDDVLVDDNWLTSLADCASRHTDADALGGPVRPWYPVAPDPDLLIASPALRTGFCGVDHDLPEGFLPAGREIYGANMAFRVDSLRGAEFRVDLGRTGEKLEGGEDREFVSRLRGAGGRILWCPAMAVRHYVDPSRMTVSYLRSLSRASGASYARWRPVEADVPRVLGLPRWMVMGFVGEYLSALWAWLTRRRARALEHLFRADRLVGISFEARRIGMSTPPGSAARDREPAQQRAAP